MLPPKRQRTRDKLLKISQEYILENGCKSLSLRDICYSAEMSSGTIYNYYRDLDELLNDIEKMAIKSYHQSLDIATRGVESPLETLAICSRQTLLNALPNASLGKLIFQGELPHKHFIHSVRERFINDMQIAIEQNLIQVEQEEALLSMAVGGMYGAMTDLHNGALSKSNINQMTELLLTMLGVDKNLAKEISNKEFNRAKVADLPLSSLEWLEESVPRP